MAKDKNAKKGLPKRVSRTGHKLRYERYKTRSTCIACSTLFKSPKHRKAHVDSGHKSFVGKGKEVKRISF